MKRKIVFAVLAAISAVIITASTALALFDYRVVEIKNLTAQYDGKNVTLKWRYKVSNNPLIIAEYPATPIKVTRKYGEKEKVLDELDYEKKDGYFEQTYVDKSLPKDAEGTVVYEISTGNRIGGITKSITIDVTPGEQATGEENAQAGPGELDRPDWSERLAAHLVAQPAKFIMHMVGLYDPVELVFGSYIYGTADGTTTNSSKTEAKEISEDIYYEKMFKKQGALPYLGTFTQHEWDAINKFYSKMNDFVPLGLVLAFVLLGMFYWYITTVPSAQITLRQVFGGAVMAVAAIWLAGYMIGFLFDLNRLAIGQFYSVVQDKISETGFSFLTAFVSFEKDGYLGGALLFLVAILCIAVINFQYAMRKVVIALLIVLLPLVAVVSVVRREVLSTWFKELCANIYIQAGHAAVLAFIIALSISPQKSSTGSTILMTSDFWLSLVALIGLIPIAGMIRRMFGAEPISGLGAGLASGLGLSSFFIIGRILSTTRALKGGKHFTTTPTGTPGLPSPNQPSGGGVTAPLASAASLGLAAGAAKLALGTAGGFMGGIIGGPAGMGIGAVAGAKTAALFAQTASAASQLLSRAKSDGFSSALGLEDSLQLYDPEAMKAAGEKTFGQNIIGRTAGTAMAGASILARKINPEQAQAIDKIRTQIKTAAETLPALQQKAQKASEMRQKAALKLDTMKTYAPNSERVQSAKELITRVGGLEQANTELKRYETAYAQAQQRFQQAKAALQSDPSNPAHMAALSSASSDLALLKSREPKVEKLREAVTTIEKVQEYKNTKAELEQIQAEEAQIKLQILETQKLAMRQDLKEYFKNIRKGRG